MLDGPVTYNSHVQRSVRTLSRLGSVMLVTAGGSEHDQALFDYRVEVRHAERPVLTGARKWLLLHRQNDHLAEAALANGRDFDVVWANDYSTLFPARQIARERRAKLVYDSLEIWLETVNQFFPRDAPVPKALAFRTIVWLCRVIGRPTERSLVEDADLVITANESYAAVLRDRLGRDDVGVVLNCPEPVALRHSDRIRHELGLAASDRIVLYQGMMNAGRGLPELIASARHFPAGVRLVLLGDGMLEASLRRLAEDPALRGRVLFGGLVPQAELHEWTSSADLGVLILDPINLSKRLALANKIFEYMAAGIPILTTDLPENRRIIDQCECGWLIADRDPGVLAENVARVLEDPDEMRRRGTNGRRWFEHRYNFAEESKRLLGYVEGIL